MANNQRWYIESTSMAVGINVDAIIANTIEATESARCESLEDAEGKTHRVWECSSWSLAERIRRNDTVVAYVRVWTRKGEGPLRPAPNFCVLGRRADATRKIVHGSSLPKKQAR